MIAISVAVGWILALFGGAPFAGLGMNPRLHRVPGNAVQISWCAAVRSIWVATSLQPSRRRLLVGWSRRSPGLLLSGARAEAGNVLTAVEAPPLGGNVS